MLRFCLTLIVCVLSIIMAEWLGAAVVVDSVSSRPLTGASVFDCRGSFIGTSGRNGRLPRAVPSSYPLVVRYLGYNERVVASPSVDTIRFQEVATQLPEVIVGAKEQKVLHIVAYVREYSTLTSYFDTVFLFREKMVDFMIPTDKKMKFKGWRRPRILSSKSYYRFTDYNGLDSVSDVSRHHFSWSDWIGVAPDRIIPSAVRGEGCAVDTIQGKYGVSEMWLKDEDKIIVDVDVLSDTACRSWVPGIAGFFSDDMEFENFKVRFNFDRSNDEYVGPLELTGYAYSVGSRGRGREMFQFRKVGKSFFADTYAEVYILDKEFITVKEARKWQRYDFTAKDIGIISAAEAPPLQPYILQLVDRVNHIDREAVRLNNEPDMKLLGIEKINKNFKLGHRVLNVIKSLTGISSYKMRKKQNRDWNNFRSRNHSSSIRKKER